MRKSNRRKKSYRRINSRKSRKSRKSYRRRNKRLSQSGRKRRSTRKRSLRKMKGGSALVAAHLLHNCEDAKTKCEKEIEVTKRISATNTEELETLRDLTKEYGEFLERNMTQIQRNQFAELEAEPIRASELAEAKNKHISEYAEAEAKHKSELEALGGAKHESELEALGGAKLKVDSIDVLERRFKDILNKNLLEAAKVGDLKKIQGYLKTDADPNFKDEVGDTPLHHVVYHAVEEAKAAKTKTTSPPDAQTLVECMEALHRAGANLDLVGADNWTPLMWAAYYGHTVAVEWLLKEGADVYKEDENKDTALKIAEDENETEVVTIIKEWVEENPQV
jgi:hypothetical protein